MVDKSSNSYKTAKYELPGSILNLDFSYAYMFGSDSVSSSIYFPIKLVLGSGNSGLIIGFQGGGNPSIDNSPLLLGRVTDGGSANDVYQSNPYTTSVTSVNYLQSYKEVDPDFILNGLMLRFGYQKAIFRGLYANLTFDVCRSKYFYSLRHEYLTYYNYDYGWGEMTDYLYTNEYEYDLNEVLWGVRSNFGLGYTISFLKSKRAYLNTEMLCSIFDRSNQYLSRFQLNIGLGFRLGTPASTKYEGVKNVTTVPIKP